MNNYPQAGNAQDRKENQPGSNRELAALPFLTGVKVKALEWIKPPLSETLSRCETEFGTYRTWTHDEANGKWFWSVEGGYNEVTGEETDEETAKAAAQADYEARIRSAIEVAPSPRAQALEEAAKIALDVSENGEYHGEASVDSTSSIYQQGAFEVYEAIRALSSQPVADGSAAARDVLTERRRQVETEGWTPEHDDSHSNGEIARAASCYITAKERTHLPTVPLKWPWSDAWWKPDGYRRNLVKAGALILAEIDRLDRLPTSPGASE